MSALRTLTQEEFAAIKAKGWLAVASFVKERAARIKVAERIRDTAKALRDADARAKIDSMLLEGEDLKKLEALMEKLSTAIESHRITESQIKQKARFYYTTHKIKDAETRGDIEWARRMRETVDRLHLTPWQIRRLDKHDQSLPIDKKLRRMLRQNAKQGAALLNLHLGLIGHDEHHYATPFELGLRNQQKKQWKEFGKKITLARDNEAVSMLTVMESASKKKLAEIYTLMKGIESYTKAAGLTWAFVTLTAPPRMHPNPENGHSTWNGIHPDEAHDWIHGEYRKAVKRLEKRGIFISGLRVVEPHKDGCPHHHVLIFAHPDDMATIEAEFRSKVPEWKCAPGLEWRLNDGTASASSYCFKYITKTINTVEQLEGEHGGVDAWRSTWAIRAFDWFGMPRRGLWRNLRAVKECPKEPLLAGLWRAAHRGDGHAFIALNGGLNVKSKDRPVISRTTGDDKTKSIEFILQETAESIKFDFKKWQQQQQPEMMRPESRADTKVAVIPNYPRKPSADAPAIQIPPYSIPEGRARNRPKLTKEEEDVEYEKWRQGCIERGGVGARWNVHLAALNAWR